MSFKVGDKMTTRTNKDKMENIIGDLRVLSDKCNRDVDKKYPFNYEYYLKELNRILTDLGQISPETVEGIGLIEDAKHKAPQGGMSGEQDAKLREISAVTDKVLSRLGKLTEENVRPEVMLENLFDRFHLIVRQLRDRHDSRETIDVKDEYDVQDLMHALMKIYFDDIRPEEWTPNYAGSSSRMDFLLKNERLAVEVKRSRDALRDKVIGEQLIIDIAKYKEHPDCETLVCFIYDPEGFVSNPTGLENDLNKLSSNELKVCVYVAPK